MTNKNENLKPNHGAYALKPNQKMYCMYWWDESSPSPVYINQMGKWQYVRNVSKDYTKAVNTFIDYCKSNSIDDFYICEKSDMRQYDTSKTGRKADNIQKFYSTLATQGFDEVILNEMSDWVEEYCVDGFFQIRNKLFDVLDGDPSDWDILKHQDISNVDAAKFINCMAARKTFAWGPFRDIYSRGIDGQSLTPAQIDFFVRICADFPSDADVAVKTEKYQQIRNDYLKELANMKPIQKSGFKQFVEGTITKAKVVEGYYGRQTKIFVKDNKGYTVYGTCPKKVANSVQLLDDLEGTQVKFLARVTRANGEQFFGFYERPTKVEVL